MARRTGRTGSRRRPMLVEDDSDDHSNRSRKRKGKAPVESDAEDDLMEVDPPNPPDSLNPQQKTDPDSLESGAAVRRRAIHKARNLEVARSRAAIFARSNADNADAQEAMELDQGEDPAPRQPQPPLPKIVQWTPSRNPVKLRRTKSTLFSMSLEVLCDNIDHLESLEGVPESIKNCIASRLHEIGKITAKTVQLLMSGWVTQISLPDCSKVEQEEFVKLIEGRPLGAIETLELGFCGRAVGDEWLSKFGFPLLSKLRLHGNFRASDSGVRKLIQSSTAGLKDVELVECYCITESCVEQLATSHCHVLEALSLEGCSNVNARKALPSLLKIPKLRKVSLSGVEEVTDEVLTELMVRYGAHLEELDISSSRVTDSGIASVKACGVALTSLRLENLKITDVSLRHVAEGCKKLCNLRLDNNDFSDEALAEYFTTSGIPITSLSVANVRKAGDKTLLALARNANRTLQKLNASFCRNMTDEGLGYLADSCTKLDEVQVFGCTQITNTFINGHSNSLLQIIGHRNGRLTSHIRLTPLTPD